MDTHGARSGYMQAPKPTETQDSKSPIQPKTSDSAPSEPRASDRKRPPRNRNLLESVHAHLSLRPRGHSSQTQPQNTTSLLPDSQAPSLQTRLSDANTDVPQLPSIVERSSHERSTSGKDTILQNGMSAPEIMARTRARQARNITPPSVTVQSQAMNSSSLLPDGGDDALQPPLTRRDEQSSTHRRYPVSDIDISPERDCAPGGPAQTQTQISQVSEYINAHKARQESPTSGSTSAVLLPLHDSRYHVPPSNPKDGISVNDTIKDMSHHPSISRASRTRLLAKLEEEKNRARGIVALENSFPNPSPFDRTFPGSADRLSVKQGPFTDPNMVDTNFIEAKLRTRAQLQVRLAAEKKSSGA
jgi:hypothetical protein